MQVIGSPAPSIAVAARRRACWRQAAKVSRGFLRGGRTSIRGDAPVSRPQSDNVCVAPGSGREHAAVQAEARVGRGAGVVDATVGRAAESRRGRRHEPAGQADAVVQERQRTRPQDQLAQERRDGEDTDSSGEPGGGIIAHVERAHGHVTRHAELMGDAAGIHTARWGGTARLPSRVEMSMAPCAAKMSWARSWLSRRM